MKGGGSNTIVPVIDLFAGPGGLNEGFSRYASWADTDISFQVKLAIEKDPVAAETLRLRSFFRQFAEGSAPEAYYNYLRKTGEHPRQTNPADWKSACAHVWNAELGRIQEKELHERISKALSGIDDWVLLGGPPCQAYSLVGRSRMTGLGVAGRDKSLSAQVLETRREERLQKFFEDARHTLYREYLRIVAVHQPAAFVMENVKGILSSKIRLNGNGVAADSERVFPHIRKDLSHPWKALRDDPRHDELVSYRRRSPRRYKLFSFVCSSLGDGSLLVDRDFLIRSEEYGIPQRRHRVIILGVREDFGGVPPTLAKGKTNTVKTVLGKMPKLRSGLSREADSPIAWQNAIRSCFSDELLSILNVDGLGARLSRVLGRNAVRLGRGDEFIESSAFVNDAMGELHRWIMDNRLAGVIQHESRAHMRTDLGRYLFAAAAATEKGVTPKLDEWPRDLLPAHKNVRLTGKEKKVTASGFLDRFRVQLWDQPSSTVTSHIAKDGHYYIHPDIAQCRSLTVREAARLQTFPDNYFFCGNRTKQYEQVGNAVPPYLAVQLAEIVANLFEE